MCLFDNDAKVDRSLCFALNVPQSEIICLLSKIMFFWMLCILEELLEEGTTPALTKCTTLHSRVEQI